MRRAARTDGPHAAIREALRRQGWYVRDLSRVGGGWPDLLAAKDGGIRLIEVKDGQLSPSRRRLTADEARVHAALHAHGVAVWIVESVDEVLGW